MEYFALGHDVSLKYFLKKFPDQDPIYNKIEVSRLKKFPGLTFGSIRNEIIEERTAKNTMQALLKENQDKPALARAKILFHWYFDIAKNEKLNGKLTEKIQSNFKLVSFFRFLHFA